MATEIRLPFPIKGLDKNWGYHDQPQLTTPDALNVRPYSTDAERARGGSRPGLVRAYTTQIGSGNPIQWLGWLDWGFGDTRIYNEDFEYDDGTLSTRTDTQWPNAGAYMAVANGYAHPAGDSLPYEDITSGEFAGPGFSTDEFDDWTLECGLKWGWGASGNIKLWVSSSSGASTDGALVTLTWTSTVVPFPGAGFYGTLKIAVASGSNGAQYTRDYGALISRTGGMLRVQATKEFVEVYWDNQLVAKCARDDGICSKAGFKISMSKATGAPAEDPYSFYTNVVDFRLLSWTLTASTRPTTIARKLVGISNRYLYAESSEGTLSGTAQDTDQFADVPLYSAAHCNGQLFILDGTTPRVFNPMATSNKIFEWTAIKGEIQKDCRLIANWRNRLVLSGSTTNPQTLFFSRLGDPWDFDYGQDDSETAFATAGGDNGRIGEPVVAIVPISDDTLVIFCTRSIYAYRGDPALGGSVRLVTDNVGIAGPNAWCTDDTGMLWFMANDGLYTMYPGGQPKCVTDTRIPEIGGYTAVSPGLAATTGSKYISLGYDGRRGGIIIALTPYATGTATHYYYDIRLKSFWPESYPDVCGPTVASYYVATTATYRKLLLGGRNGYLYSFDDTSKSDVVDGSTSSAISSYVWIGPVRMSGLHKDAKITRLVGVLGNASGAASDAVTWGIYSGATPEAALVATALATGTWSAGRNQSRPRVRGGALALKLSNTTISKRWSLEACSIEVEAGGLQRS